MSQEHVLHACMDRKLPDLKPGDMQAAAHGSSALLAFYPVCSPYNPNLPKGPRNGSSCIFLLQTRNFMGYFDGVLV